MVSNNMRNREGFSSYPVVTTTSSVDVELWWIENMPGSNPVLEFTILTEKGERHTGALGLNGDRLDDLITALEYARYIYKRNKSL